MKELGKLLKEKRLSKGLTYDAVHKAIKIQEKYLKAIETGDEKLFAAEVYYKSFVRSYANFLGLDSGALLKEYDIRKVSAKPQAEEQPPVNFKRDSQKKPVESQIVEETKAKKPIDLKKFMIAIVAVLVLLAAFVYLNKKISNFEPSNVRSEYKPTVAESRSEPAVSHAKTSAAPAVSLISRQKVNLEAVDTVWVQVNADGKDIFEGTLLKGESKEFFADSSFILRIGYTPGIKVSFNGSPVDVQSGAIQNVKTVILKKQSGK